MRNTLILIFVFIATSFSSVFAQALRGNLDTNTAECNDCLNYYIKNGCFECYDSLLLNTHPYYKDPGHGGNYHQFQKPLDIVEPIVSLYQRRDSNCIGWYSPTGGTPNYFHMDFDNDQNEEPINWFDVPTNRMNEGNPIKYGSLWKGDNTLDKGYTGFYISPVPEHAIISKREFIQQKLKNPLSPDSCYFVSFDVSLAKNSMSGLDKIGAYLSNQAPYNSNLDEMLYAPGTSSKLIKPQIVSMGIVSNYNDWTTVSGYITPIDSINYITIGYFEDSFREGIQHQDTIAYFIDNVTIENHIDSSAYPSPINNCNECCDNISYYLDIRADQKGRDSLDRCIYDLKITDLRNAKCNITKIRYKSEQSNNYSNWITVDFEPYLIKESDYNLGELTIANPNGNVFEIEFEIYFNGSLTPCEIDTTINNCYGAPPCDFDFEFTQVGQDTANGDCCYEVTVINNDRNANITAVTITDNENNSFTEVINHDEEIFDLSQLLCFDSSEEGQWKYFDITIERSKNSTVGSCYLIDSLKVNCDCNCNNFENLEIRREVSSDTAYLCCCYDIYLDNNTDCSFTYDGLRIQFADSNLTFCDIFEKEPYADLKFSDDSLLDLVIPNNVIDIPPDTSLLLTTVCVFDAGPRLIRLQPFENIAEPELLCSPLSIPVYCQSDTTICNCFVTNDYNFITKCRDFGDTTCCADLEIINYDDPWCYLDSTKIILKDSSTNEILSVFIDSLKVGSNRFSDAICYNQSEDLSEKIIEIMYIQGNDTCSYNIDFDVFCGCPSDIDDWFTAYLGKDSINCDDTECRVSYSFDIPEEYNCFDIYEIKNDGTNLVNYETLPENNEIVDLDFCIPPNDTLDLTIILKRNVFDQDPCIIERSLFCDYDCCEFIDVSFVAESADEGECCWMPVVTTQNDSLCSADSISIVYYDNEDNIISTGGVICLPDSVEANIYYDISINGQTCSTSYASLECDNCDCPPGGITDGWINLTVDKNSGGCDPASCELTASFNIDSMYSDCFVGYSSAYMIHDINNNRVDSTSEFSLEYPMPESGIIEGLPSCIGPGESVQVAVELVTALGNTCEIFSTATFCEPFDVTDRIDGCDPDSLDNWNHDKVTINLNGCQYQVTYKYRKNPDGKQDVQITSVTNSEACEGSAENSEIFSKALRRSIKQILDNEEDWKPQKNSDTVCVDTWRVIQGTCWSKWTASGTHDTNMVVQLPCLSGCCVRQLRVCYFDSVYVDDLGISEAGTFDCDTASLPDPIDEYPELASSGCYVNDCENYEGFTDYAGDNEDWWEDNNGMAKRAINEHYDTDVLILYQLYAYNSTVKLRIADSEVEDLTLNMYDINGSLIRSVDFELSGGYQEFSIDATDLMTGVYLYSLTNNNRKLSTGKFTIVK